MLISSVLGGLQEAWVAKALGTAEATGPVIFGHMQPYLFTPARVPYKYFMRAINVEKHEKQPGWLSSSVAGLVGTCAFPFGTNGQSNQSLL